jgi:hypothetical protein
MNAHTLAVRAPRGSDRRICSCLVGYPSPVRGDLRCQGRPAPAGWQVGAEALVPAQAFLGGVHVEVAWQRGAVVFQDRLAVPFPDRSVGVNAQR